MKRKKRTEYFSHSRIGRELRGDSVYEEEICEECRCYDIDLAQEEDKLLAVPPTSNMPLEEELEQAKDLLARADWACNLCRSDGYMG